MSGLSSVFTIFVSKIFKYVSFETFNNLANYFVLGKSNNEDSRTKLLKLLDPLYNYLVENKFLAKD